MKIQRPLSEDKESSPPAVTQTALVVRPFWSGFGFRARRAKPANCERKRIDEGSGARETGGRLQRQGPRQERRNGALVGSEVVRSARWSQST